MKNVLLMAGIAVLSGMTNNNNGFVVAATELSEQCLKDTEALNEDAVMKTEADALANVLATVDQREYCLDIHEARVECLYDYDDLDEAYGVEQVCMAQEHVYLEYSYTFTCVGDPNVFGGPRITYVFDYLNVPLCAATSCSLPGLQNNILDYVDAQQELFATSPQTSTTAAATTTGQQQQQQGADTNGGNGAGEVYAGRLNCTSNVTMTDEDGTLYWLSDPNFDRSGASTFSSMTASAFVLFGTMIMTSATTAAFLLW